MLVICASCARQFVWNAPANVRSTTTIIAGSALKRVQVAQQNVLLYSRRPEKIDLLPARTRAALVYTPNGVKKARRHNMFYDFPNI